MCQTIEGEGKCEGDDSTTYWCPANTDWVLRSSGACPDKDSCTPFRELISTRYSTCWRRNCILSLSRVPNYEFYILESPRSSLEYQNPNFHFYYQTFNNSSLSPLCSCECSAEGTVSKDRSGDKCAGQRPRAARLCPATTPCKYQISVSCSLEEGGIVRDNSLQP